MGKQIILFIFLLSPFFSHAEDSVELCDEGVIPLSPLELEWPGVPAGGLEAKTILETVSLKFIVNELGMAENIDVVVSSSYAYIRGARRTVLKATFHKPDVKCIKYMDIRYEDART